MKIWIRPASAAAFSLIGLFNSPLECQADNFADTLSGKAIPTFTLVYSVERHKALDGVPRSKIAAEVHQELIQRRQLLVTQYHFTAAQIAKAFPETWKKNMTDGIMNEAGGSGKSTVLISQRDGKLFVKKIVPKRNETWIFVYDGKNSMETIRGYDVQIYPGLKYSNLRDFVFPGFGVLGFPIARNLTLIAGAKNTYAALVALDDGAADQDLPQYPSGRIATKSINGAERIIRAEGGYGRRPAQIRSYSDYHKVAGGLEVPGTIRLEEYYSPESVLAFGKQEIVDYKLISASPQALPATDFTFEGQLPSAAKVQDNTKKEAAAIRYTPGKPLAQQFQDEEQHRVAAELSTVAESGSRRWTGVIGLLALITALCGWFFYRRTLAIRKWG